LKNLFEKIKIAKQQNRLFYAVKSRALPYLNQLKYIHNPGSKYIEITCPDYQLSISHNEENIVLRIFESFRKMKLAQQDAHLLYKPSSAWQKHLNNSYSYLLDGLKNNDIEKFHFFLKNFGAWKGYHGIESNTLINSRNKTMLGRHYLKNVLFHQNFQFWLWFYNSRKSPSLLSYPRFGNQTGAYIKNEAGDKIFVGSGSFSNEIYGSILANLIDDIKRPVVADLGAGYGKLAYFTLRDIKDFCFVDFDLPEVLCLAAYYLMKVWPDKKVLLFGEEEFSENSFKKYDMIFMPSFMIDKLKSKTVDLFINKNSLGEMNSDAVINYMKYINLSSEYFFHMNHEIYPNVYDEGNKGLLGYEYPIKIDDFKLIMRYPDISHMLYNGSFDKYMDIFFYLYQRRSKKHK
jgi:hypothetical protein